MKWFYDNKWTSFTISQLVEQNEIPKKSFVVTFDDGGEITQHAEIEINEIKDKVKEKYNIDLKVEQEIVE